MKFVDRIPGKIFSRPIGLPKVRGILEETGCQPAKEGIVTLHSD